MRTNRDTTVLGGAPAAPAPGPDAALGGAAAINPGTDVRPLLFALTSVNEARSRFAEVISAACDHGQWVPFTRHGKLIAAIAPIGDVEEIDRLSLWDGEDDYRVSLGYARKNFAEVVNTAAYGNSGPVVLTKHNKSVACIVSVECLMKFASASRPQNTKVSSAPDWGSVKNDHRS